MSVIRMLITLTDENDNSPNFITTNVEVEIPEHSDVDYPVTTITVSVTDVFMVLCIINFTCTFHGDRVIQYC